MGRFVRIRFHQEIPGRWPQYRQGLRRSIAFLGDRDLYNKGMHRSAAGSTGLALSLRLGAVYDWLLAAAILTSPPALLSTLHFPAPADPFLFRLSVLPLVLFPFVYLSAAAGKADSGGVPLSILLRSGGGSLLAVLTFIYRPPGAPVYLAIAAIDLAWAAIHAALAARAKAKTAVV
jgi:hypothetical protein